MTDTNELDANKMTGKLDVGAVEETSILLEDGQFSRGDLSKKTEDAPTDLVNQRFFNPVSVQWQKATCERLGVELKSRLKTGHFKALAEPKRRVNAVPDGNCFYRSLSVWITGDQSAHRLLRQKLAEFMLESTHVRDFLGGEEAHQLYFTEAEVWKDGEWATEVEIMAASIMLKTNIMIYCSIGQNWDWQMFCRSGLYTESLALHEQCIYLMNTNFNHFDPVTDVEHNSEDRGDANETLLNREKEYKECFSEHIEKELLNAEDNLETIPEEEGIDISYSSEVFDEDTAADLIETISGEDQISVSSHLEETMDDEDSGDAYKFYKTLYNIEKGFKEHFDDPYDKALPYNSYKLESIYEEEEIDSNDLNEAYSDKDSADYEHLVSDEEGIADSSLLSVEEANNEDTAAADFIETISGEEIISCSSNVEEAMDDEDTAAADFIKTICEEKEVSDSSNLKEAMDDEAGSKSTILGELIRQVFHGDNIDYNSCSPISL